MKKSGGRYNLAIALKTLVAKRRPSKAALYDIEIYTA
jgi:hypothetical protein